MHDVLYIRALESKYTAVFRIAIDHLFTTGQKHFTPENVEHGMKQIDEKHDESEAIRATGKVKGIPIMSRSFEKAVLQCTFELAKFDLWSILLYIKKYMDIDDPTVLTYDNEDED